MLAGTTDANLSTTRSDAGGASFDALRLHLTGSHSAVALEPRLSIIKTPNCANPAVGDIVAGAPVAAHEVTAHSHNLVILGVPGAGKTWLARRIAREAARCTRPVASVI